MIAGLSDAKRQALETLAGHFKGEIQNGAAPAIATAVRDSNIITFGESNFYIPETGAPIRLVAHQPLILDYAFDPANHFQTIFYSTVKKSGKTTIASLVARWIAETWGQYNEIYCMANDLEQARGRVYSGIQHSIELDPKYDHTKSMLPDKWKIIGRELRCLRTQSLIKAVSGDYRGEAGSNPTATFWSELWGYTSEDSLRLWDELTPVPTRPRSIRFVETYAGFEDESSLLKDLWDLAKRGRQLTIDDMPSWPGPEGKEDWAGDLLPLWRNDRARLFAYIDTGEIARRMPWQTPEYYAVQAEGLRDKTFRRLHLNEWTTSLSAFVQIEWWDSCLAALPPITDKNTPITIGVDAAVSDDCIALVGVSRHPDKSLHNTDVDVRFVYIWTPPVGGQFDYEAPGGLLPTLRSLIERYDVVEVAYDAYQLHQPMTNLRRDSKVWTHPFSQMGDRAKADKDLFGLIRDRRLRHGNEPELRMHIQNAASKQAVNEDTKFRIVKKTKDQKIDGAVALSMACYESLRLNL